MKRIFHTPFFIRLFHWEYWNSRLVYAPLYPYWLWLSIRARSFFFLTAANPAIRNGGFIMESKKDVYDLLPAGTFPATCYFANGVPVNDMITEVSKAGLTFPVIAKPDHGERGLGVKKINNMQELAEYAKVMPIPFLVQKYVSFPNEVGLFYYRFPGETSGHISGIVNKEPVTIVGDGVHTIAELTKENPRYLLQWKQISILHADKLDKVPEAGERLVLVPYGNHSRGSKFTDVSFRTTQALTDTINKLCSNISGFYFGRLDIRFNTWEELERGENISVIELNGSGSEPTHIYDPSHSLFFAWKEIIRHWNIMYRISKMNNSSGTKYLTLAEGRREVQAFRRIDAALSSRTW